MILLIFMMLHINVTQTPQFIIDYHIVNTKEDELNFIRKYKNEDNVNIIPYVLSLRMKQAEYKFFPWDKISIFKKEKHNLEQWIKKYPNNIHFRYIRLVIQENTPSFLKYNSSIKNDKIFINKLLKINDDSDYLDKYILKNTSL